MRPFSDGIPTVCQPPPYTPRRSMRPIPRVVPASLSQLFHVRSVKRELLLEFAALLIARSQLTATRQHTGRRLPRTNDNRSVG